VVDQGLRRLLAKAIQKVSHEEITATIVSPSRTRPIIRPGVELCVGAMAEHPVGTTDVKVVELHGQLRHPLVDPRVFVAVGVPMDHVLKLVGQHAIVKAGTWLHAPIQVDVEHLFLVGELVNQAGVFVSTGKVARHATAQFTSVKDVQVYVVVHARRPLAPKEAPVGGIGLRLKSLRRARQGALVNIVSLLYPHVDMGRNVA